MKRIVIILSIILLDAFRSGAGQPTFIYGDSLRFFPEGTRWIEIQLNTKEHNDWFSKEDSGDRTEWIPNYKVREFYVEGKHEIDYVDQHVGYRNVYVREDGKDSFVLYITELEFSNHYYIIPALPELPELLGESNYYWNLEAFVHWHPIYDFDWQVGKLIRSIPYYSNEASLVVTINEIKEDKFGGVRDLKYVDLENGQKLIHGIGLTESLWPDCILGPSRIWSLNTFNRKISASVRSMLVYFERNGEVLYNLWPEPANTNGLEITSVKRIRRIYDLNGRRLNGRPNQKGLYIQDGKKVVIK